MHADHSIAVIIAHVMIAFLFVYRGLDSLPNFADHLKRFEDRGVPFPRFVLACGFATMLIGGVLVGLDLYTPYAGAMLILFTVLANLLYHDFWKMEEPRMRQTHTWIFCNNIAVMGGLLLTIAT